MLHKITNQNFQALVLNHDQPVVVDVWADWCGPCKMLAPQFQQAATELQGKARFVKLDADKNPKLVKKYQVMNLPTLLFFKDGKLVNRQIGITTAKNIVRQVQPLLAEGDNAGNKSERNWKFWK